MKRVLVALGLAILIPAKVLAWSSLGSGPPSGKERDGGNTQGLSRKEIRRFIQNALKEEVTKLVLVLSPEELKGELALRYNEMVAAGLLADIKSSRYIFSDEGHDRGHDGGCNDKNGQSRGATSVRGQLGGISALTFLS